MDDADRRGLYQPHACTFRDRDIHEYRDDDRHHEQDGTCNGINNIFA